MFVNFSLEKGWKEGAFGFRPCKVGNHLSNAFSCILDQCIPISTTLGCCLAGELQELMSKHLVVAQEILVYSRPQLIAGDSIQSFGTDVSSQDGGMRPFLPSLYCPNNPEYCVLYWLCRENMAAKMQDACRNRLHVVLERAKDYKLLASLQGYQYLQWSKPQTNIFRDCM